MVALGIYHPDMIDENNEIRKAAIKIDTLRNEAHTDICGDSTGLSVARLLGIRSIQELKKCINDISSRPQKDGSPRRPVGHAKISVKWLRENGLIVLDDGKIEFTSHAVIRSEMPESETKKVRHDLLAKLNSTLEQW